MKEGKVRKLVSDKSEVWSRGVYAKRMLTRQDGLVLTSVRQKPSSSQVSIIVDLLFSALEAM